MSETCQDCKSIDASFICVCLERHLCDNCLLTHISHAEGNEHRPVSLSHPLLTLLLQASEVASNAEESIINSNVPHKIQVIENQVKNLERFKERTNSLVNLKIQNLKAEMKKTPEQNPMEIAKKPDIPQLQTPKFNFSPERPISSLSSIRKEDYVKPLYLDRPSSRIQFSANKI